MANDELVERYRSALEHYANIDHWTETTWPAEVNTAGYLSFEYDGGYDLPWKVARAALDGEPLGEGFYGGRPPGHDLVADAGPHDFEPLGRFLHRHKCRHCFSTEHEHPILGWVPARPYGDKR